MMPVELRISSSTFFKIPSVLVYTHVNVGCIHESETPYFSYSTCWIKLFYRWSTFGCLAVFHRLNGRKNLSLFFPFDYLVALIINRYGIRFNSWAMRLLTGTVLLLPFLLSQPLAVHLETFNLKVQILIWQLVTKCCNFSFTVKILSLTRNRIGRDCRRSCCQSSTVLEKFTI